jgi:PAS domain S-box-containing protein
VTISNRTFASSALGRYLARVAIVFAAQFAAGKLGDILQTLNKGGIGPVWPAAGVALGLLLLWGNSVWPGVAAGAFLLTYLGPVPHWAAVCYAIGTTLAAMVGAYLVRSIAEANLSLARLRDVLALVVFGALGSAVVSASIGAATLYAAHIQGWSGFGSAWLIYWLGDSTGVLMVTPLILTAPTLLQIRGRNRITELASLLILLTATCFVLFGDLPFIPVRLHILAFAVLPFVMWAAIRFGMSTTVLSIFLVATVATVETALGFGPFASGAPLTNAVLLDLFFAVLSISGLALAAAIAEREQSEHERERLVRERAEAEARLRFAAIVESSEDAIASGTMDGTIVSWNAGAQRVYGYTEEEAVGKPITILIPPELPDEENQILEKLKAGGRIEHFETVRVTKTGKRIHVSLTISLIKDSSGAPVGISGIARDITERKLTERELATASERLHLAIESGSVGGWDYDVKTGKSVWFGKAHAQLGMTPGETSGSAEEFWDRVHKDDREHLQHAIQTARDTRQEFTEDFRVVWRDGTTHWLRARGRYYYSANGEPRRMLAVSLDTTERKQAEEALRESEERFRLVANAAPVMIWMSGLDRVPTYFSQLWLAFSGLSETDLQKGLAGIIHPEDYPKCEEIYSQSFDQRQAFRTECRLRRHDGKYRWMLNIGVPRFHKDGSFAGYIGSCIDVTEHKIAEESLSGMSRKLIEAQEQERARIARELHDDINQRIALFAVELEQLKQHPSEIESRVQELRKQATEISSDVQALSHDLHSSKLDYLGVVGGMKSWCRELAERQKLEINFKSDVSSPVPRELGTSLFRVLQEALQNAAKHSGVRRIDVQLREHRGEVYLMISDAGKGFDVEAARLGKGLGLTSMRERVRLVNGTFAIDSKPMGGTTIHVRVPVESNEQFQRKAV